MSPGDIARSNRSHQRQWQRDEDCDPREDRDEPDDQCHPSQYQKAATHSVQRDCPPEAIVIINYHSKAIRECHKGVTPSCARICKRALQLGVGKGSRWQSSHYGVTRPADFRA